MKSQVLLEFLLVDRDVARSGRGHGQDRDSLMMTGEAGALRHVAGAAFLDQGQSFGDGFADFFRRRHRLRGPHRTNQNDRESGREDVASRHVKSPDSHGVSSHARGLFAKENWQEIKEERPATAAGRLLLGKSWCLVEKRWPGVCRPATAGPRCPRQGLIPHGWRCGPPEPADNANPAHLSCFFGPLLCSSDKRGDPGDSARPAFFSRIDLRIPTRLIPIHPERVTTPFKEVHP